LKLSSPVLLDCSIFFEKSNDLPDDPKAESESSTARSSLSEATSTCGEPRVIALHTVESNIHGGNSRDNPRRTSTCTTSLPRRPVRRISGTFSPNKGCHRYSTTISFDRYAECRSLPPSVTKHIERSVARIIAKAAAHQTIKAIKAFAHIAATD
jgi:hypothetical protein